MYATHTRMSTLVQHSMTHFNIFFPKPASPLPRFLYECMYVFRPLLVKFYNFVAVFIYNECVWLLGFEMWTCVWVLFDMCVSFEFVVSVFTTDQRQQKPAGIPVFCFSYCCCLSCVESRHATHSMQLALSSLQMLVVSITNTAYFFQFRLLLLSSNIFWFYVHGIVR